MQQELLKITELQFRLDQITQKLKEISSPSSSKPVSYEYLGLVIEEMKIKRELGDFYLQ
jgi:division protein CdvB (Snf7/Vps24/ESCRT-III family)